MDDKSDKGDKGVLDLVAGITRIDPLALAPFQQAMNDEVIPEIVKVVEERRVLAAESRLRQLKDLGG